MSVPTHRANLVDFFIKLIHHHGGGEDSILDLCCGELQKPFKKYWGTRYEGLDNRPEVHADYTRDACDLSIFKSNSRGTVTCFSGVEHVNHPYTLISEAKRVSNNICVFTTDYHQHDKDGDISHLYSWTPKTFTQLITSIHKDSKVYVDHGMIIGVLYRCGTK